MKANYRVLLSTLLVGRDSTALQRAQVRALLVAQGVDGTAAEARVAALTDDEAAVLASNSNG